MLSHAVSSLFLAVQSATRPVSWWNVSIDLRITRLLSATSSTIPWPTTQLSTSNGSSQSAPTATTPSSARSRTSPTTSRPWTPRASSPSTRASTKPSLPLYLITSQSLIAPATLPASTILQTTPATPSTTLCQASASSTVSSTCARSRAPQARAQAQYVPTPSQPIPDEFLFANPVSGQLWSRELLLSRSHLLVQRCKTPPPPHERQTSLCLFELVRSNQLNPFQMAEH